MIPIIFILPFVQTLVLVYAATLELKNTKITIVDQDHSALSQKLISKFEASSFFDIDISVYDDDLIKDKLLKDSEKAVLVIPANFENDLREGIPAHLQLNINAIDGQGAGLIVITSYSIHYTKLYDLLKVVIFIFGYAISRALL